ncbi:MAG: cohesin domain-containing protein, partial [Saprospiraceae bacterium]
MNRIPPTATRSFLIGCFCLIPFLNFLMAQSYFSLTEVSISPSSPTNYDIVTLTLSGLRQDSCTSLESLETTISSFDLNIDMEWDSIEMPVCNGAMIPWTTEMELGILPDGSYTINLTGSNYTNDSSDPLSFVITESAVGPCGANNITWVTNTADLGPGSLREAIACANADPDFSNIYFDIPGNGPHEISVGSNGGQALPTLLFPTNVDATTQPGFDPLAEPAVAITGRNTIWISSFIDGLHLAGNNSSVFGLGIYAFPGSGVLIGGDHITVGQPGEGNTIIGIGQDFIPGNTNTGMLIGTGIRVAGGTASTAIVSNYIGTTIQSTLSGNSFCGIYLEEGCNNIKIGGIAEGEGNVIADNANGLIIEPNSDFNEIIRNQFFCNDTVAIKNIGNANTDQAPPIITAVSSMQVSGTASVDDEIEVYISSRSCPSKICQGETYLGTTITDAMGNWELNTPFATGDTIIGGTIITATATAPNRSSSEFADCFITAGISDCTDSVGVIRVTTIDDEGPGSLREAMICADTTLGANRIHFDIVGTGPFVINVGATTGLPLPSLTDPGTVIDASTQSGFGGGGNFSPMIILNGSANTWDTPDAALKVTAGFTEIYALEITGFPNSGIEIIDAVDCIIGASEKGNVIYNNGSTTDFFPALPGEGPFEGSGIHISGNTTRIQISGNYIGTDYTQTNTNGNEYCGILIDGGIDYIGIGGDLADRNIIANNAEGIRVKEMASKINIRRNAFYCNDTVAIRLESGANTSQPIPVWDLTSETSLTMLSGQAEMDAALVDIYRVDEAACSTAPCQGRTYLGTANVSNQEWILTAPFTNGVSLSNGDLLTAIAIDTDGNTSEFSECHIAANCTLSANTTALNNASCELANGSFSVTVSGGPTPYTFDIGNGAQNSASFTNLPAGIYNVTVTDAYTCSATTSVTINDPGLPTTSVQQVLAESCDMANGFVIMNQATGGTGPYSYNLENGNQPNNPNFVNLSAGDYTLTVTDNTGCTNIAPVNVPFVEGPTLFIESTTNESCSESNGSVTLGTTTGTPIFSYNIGGSNQTNPTFSGIPAGTYEAMVTDDNGCTDSEFVTFINIEGPTDLQVTNVSPDFCGQSNGTVTVEPLGGNSPYTYDIGFGEENDNFFANLSAGSYSITATDFNLCTVTVSVEIPTGDGPDLSVSSSTDANCGFATGSATIEATDGTPPFVFNIGEGDQTSSTFSNLEGGAYEVTVTDNNNCTSTLPFSINDLGSPIGSIGSLTDATCEQTNGSVTLSTTGGISPYTFNIGNGNTSDSTFNALSEGAYNITITDASDCSSVLPIAIGNNGLLAFSSFIYVDDNGTVTFTSTAENAEDFAWDFGDGTSSVLENPTHTFPNNNTYNVCLTVSNDDCGAHTSCQDVLIQTSVILSGIVEKENGVPVANVKMMFSAGADDFTDLNGEYATEGMVGDNFTITPEKDTLYGNGLSAFDIFKIQQHILLIEDLDSPYKIIAADVNRSSSISAFDVLLMQRVILQIVDTFPGNTSWRFVEKSYVFPDPTQPFNSIFPDEILLNGLTQDLDDLDFIAIKVGDVTLDANPGVVGEDDPSGQIEMRLSSKNWTAGEEISIPIRASEIEELAALQFSIKFDTDKLQFEKIIPGSLKGLDENDFNIKTAEDGLLSLGWFDKHGHGQAMADNSILFYLNFKAISEGELEQSLFIQPHRNLKNAYQSNGNTYEVNTVFIKSTEDYSPAVDSEIIAQPNPFHDHVNILLRSSKKEIGELSLFDISGSLLFKETVRLNDLQQQIRLSNDRFPTK